MKRSWTCIACILLLLVIVLPSCANRQEPENRLPENPPSTSDDGSEKNIEEKKSSYQLIVFGEDISNENVPVSMYSDYVELPLLAILNAIGASSVWESDTVARIEYRDETYFLDISQGLLYHQEKVFVDLNVSSPGTWIEHEHDRPDIVSEYVVPDHCTDLFADKFGIKIHVDHTQKTVSVQERDR